MQTFWQCLGKERGGSLWAPLLKMFEAILELCIPLLLASLIDRALLPQNPTALYQHCLYLLILITVALGCSLCAQYLAARSAAQLAANLKTRVFAQALALSAEDFGRKGAAQITNLLCHDADEVQNGFNLALRLLLRSPFIVLGSIAMAFSLDWHFGWLFLFVSLLLLGLVIFLLRRSLPKWQAAQQAQDGLFTLCRDGFRGRRVIRSLNAEASAASEFEQENQRERDLRFQAARSSTLIAPLCSLCFNLAIIILLYVGNLRVRNLSLSLGTYLALYNYLAQIIIELLKFGNLIFTINRGLASFLRLRNFLKPNTTLAAISPAPASATATNTTTAPSSAPAAITLKNEPAAPRKYLLQQELGKLEVTDLTFSYPEAPQAALRQLNFSLAPGEHLGLIGGTGAGKSTLLYLLNRFYTAARSQLSYAGKDILDYDLAGWRSELAYVPQEPSFFSESIAANLRRAKPEATTAELWQCLELAQAADFVRQLDGQLAYVLPEAGRRLSGGQRQRLALARALLRRAKILLLDDVFAQVDMLTEAKLRRNLAELDWRPSLILVAQRCSSLFHCQRIMVLDEGQIVALGPHEQLLHCSPLYRALYQTQNADLQLELAEEESLC